MQTAIERRDLAQFIEENKQEILERWAGWRRQERKSGQLTREQLLDHLPRLLDAIAQALRGGGSMEEMPDTDPARHALMRLDQGFDLDQVVEEYAILRQGSSMPSASTAAIW